MEAKKENNIWAVRVVTADRLPPVPDEQLYGKLAVAVEQEVAGLGEEAKEE